MQYNARLAIAAGAQWHNPEDVKASYPRASILKGGRVVFNIKDNDYRLIATLQYRAGVLAFVSSGPLPNMIKSKRRPCDGCDSDLDR